MTDRLLWQLIVILAATLASLLGSLLCYWLMPQKKKTAVKKSRSRAVDDEDEDDDDDEPSRKKSRSRSQDDDDEDDYDRPARKRSPASSKANTVLVLVLGGFGAGILLVLGLCVLAIIVGQMTKDRPGVIIDPPGNPILVEPVAENLGPKEKQTAILGGGGHPTFKDEGPNGALLIGFDVGLGKFMDIDLVKAVQPKYQTPQGEVAGRKIGTEFNQVISVKAKPGYAVGAIDVKAGLLVNGFSVKFMRIKGGVLDPADFYSSEWIGDKTGGNRPILLGGDGTPIVGVIGQRNARDCVGIGLLKK